MTVVKDLARKEIGSFSPSRAGEIQKLTENEVARMGCHDIKKSGFGLGIA